MTTAKNINSFHRLPLPVLVLNAIKKKKFFLLSEYHQVVIRVSFISWEFSSNQPYGCIQENIIRSRQRENYANCRI